MLVNSSGILYSPTPRPVRSSVRPSDAAESVFRSDAFPFTRIENCSGLNSYTYDAVSLPGVLIEVGYCTNKTEAERLAVDAYRASIARGIANGILIYTGKM